jgi:hypothetical protein
MYMQATETIISVIKQELDPQKQYEAVAKDVLCKELIRCIRNPDPIEPWNALYLRCWREVTPEPTAPLYRSEDVA